jgi:hypothetical protein
MAFNTTIRENFKRAFEQKCFLLLKEAYQTSLSQKVIQLDWNENDISAELHKHIEDNSQRLLWQILAIRESYIAKDIPKVKGYSDKFPRIDFKFGTFASGSEYGYYFEAKILKQYNPGLKRRYIETGIDSFASRKYENGSLLAYLMEGKIDETISGINALLIKDKRHTETLMLKSSEALGDFYESTHSDIGILKHLIFDFTSFSG